VPSAVRARSAVAAVDVELADRAATRGTDVAPGRVRRWRLSGLLPTPDVVGTRPPGAPPGRLPQRHTSDRLIEIDATIDVLVRYARRGRGAHDLALILFAHGLPVDVDLVRAAIASNQETTRSLFIDLIRTAQERFPAPTDIGLELDEDFERAEALARLAVEGQPSSVRKLRQNLRSSGRPATNVDLLQVTTHLFQTLGGADDGESDDSAGVSTNLMTALGMDGMLESVAEGVPPLLEGGSHEFLEAATAVGDLALLPLPSDLSDEELFAARDFAVILVRALRAVPDPGLLHHLGGPILTDLWDPSDPGRIAITSSLLVQLTRIIGVLDPSPIVDAIREQGWMDA
jgi:hypothetical protein